VRIKNLKSFTMEYYNLQKLIGEWGNKPCEHPSFEKVYYAGAFLTVYCCTSCGKEFTIAQKMEIDEIRKVKV
jgi:hypothetical protein